MATPYKIHVPVNDTGLLKFAQSETTANTTSELLQKDLETHHVFFNAMGYHNHIVHHLLSLYGTGADASAIRKAFADNDTYQLPVQPTHPAVADELAADWATAAPKYLGQGKHYPDFLLFFQREIDRRGGDFTAGVSEFLFRGDARADDLLQRVHAGFLHPLIQLMYGLEWRQPAIIAEGLAQAAVHQNKLGPFLERTEREARAEAMPPLAELYRGIRADERLRAAVRADDQDKIFDGILSRAPDAMLEFTSHVRVAPEEVEERIAEMFETAIWAAGGAALRPGKVPKWDFFLIHHINSVPFHVTVNDQPWIPAETKARLLEWKIRLDLAQYAARGSPPNRFDDVKTYRPKDLDEGKQLVSHPNDLLPRFHATKEDGHAIKLVRALGICKELLDTKFKDKQWRKITEDDLWLKLHYMVLDGTEYPQDGLAMWVRGAGFDEMWRDVPDRK
ncbi:hypothetical protein SODALDRAFT_327381 [Sodiomyces alkalinus F11]|uniref:HypA protein n=1 Tax=Sodiomyces alkalinus (strain CBS 110278 / VKM F-3762 / F11) TaxID=1314773 RepID=A0A3N2Q8Y1_SODAK|nr:hypothetical protein SODALDRAFT_327381 [Sodiomyces alkalinus F11]ROT43200.1 hypothetical protein SODALDRAFT_327381 [Sodiomyces alkalinus F11]